MSCYGGRCKKSRASSYDNEVALKKLDRGTRDAVGGYSGAQATLVRNIWCKIRPVRGFERLTDERITETVDTVFTTDYLNVTDLLAAADRTEWRLTYDGVDFNITHIIDVNEAHKAVEIYAVRGEAA